MSSESPVRDLLARGSIYTIGTAIQFSASLLVVPIVTRVMSAPEYGLLALALIIQLLIVLVGTAGLGSVITRAYFRDGEGPDAARSLIPATIAIATAVALVADLTGDWWAPLLTDSGYDQALRLAVYTAPAGAAVISAQAMLRAQDRPGMYVVIGAAAGLGAQGAGLVVLLATDGGPGDFMVGFLAGYSVAGLLALIISGGLRAGFAKRAFLLRSLAIGMPTVTAIVAGYLLAFGDRVPIERYEGLDGVGRYQVAYITVLVGITFIQALSSAWLPLIFGAADDERRWSTLAETNSAVYSVAAVVAAGLAVACPLIFLVAAPPSYGTDDLAPVGAIVALSLLPYVSFISAQQVLIWVGRTALLAGSMAIAAALGVGLAFLLVPGLGLEGAALATVAGYLVLAVAIRRAAAQMAEVPWNRFVDVTGFALASIAVGVASVAPAEGSWLIVRGLAGVGLLGVFVLRVRWLMSIEGLGTGDTVNPLGPITGTIRVEPGRKTRLHTHRGDLIGIGELVRLPRQIARGLRGRPPKSEPWIAPPAIRWLNRRIAPSWSVLELGAGGSTRWFAERAGEGISVETDREWLAQVRAELGNARAEHWRLEVVDPGGIASFVEGLPDGSFDLVLVDHTDSAGNSRADSVAVSARKVKPGGLLILDDSDREAYAAVDQTLAGWRVRRFAGIKHHPVALAVETSAYTRPG